MAKEQFNCRLNEEVKALIKAEAERLTGESGKRVSDADVVERAVIRLCDPAQSLAGLAAERGERFPVPAAIEGQTHWHVPGLGDFDLEGYPLEQKAVIAVRGPVPQRSSGPARALPNASGGFEPRKDGHCAHCDEDFELMPGAPPTSICRKCVVDGHRTGVDCRKCAEREHWAKKAAKDSVERPDVDYSAFND